MVTAATRVPEKRGRGDAVPGPHRRRTPSTNPVWRRMATEARVPVSHPADPSEREADRIADAVVRSPGDGVVQRRAAAGADGWPAAHGGALVSGLGSGSPLDASTRAWFEPRIGADLRGVRIHTDRSADRAARDLNAHAFTAGSHIAFADGQYSPDTGAGRRLIAHELVHVLQGGPTIHRSAVPSGVTPGVGEGERPGGALYVPASTPRVPRIPSPEVCPPPKGMTCLPGGSPPGAVTNTYQFDQDSAALTALQRKDIDAAASAWHTAGGTMTVRIDGYASAEGACDYNWTLSCKRAEAVRGELEHPSDRSPGVPSGSIETVAHGESDDAGHVLAPNRRATISIPVPPPPPVPAPPACALPVSLGVGRTGCGSGPDFTHYDFPSISAASEAKLAAWAALRTPGNVPFRSLVSDADCMTEMDAVLIGTSGTAGHDAFAHFVGGSGSSVTLGSGSTLGGLALTAPSFLATVRAVQSAIEAQLAVQASAGALDPCALSVAPPATHFSLGGPDPLALQGVIGGTHGERVSATAFTGSVPLRTYSITLRFLICDNFGVDEHDLYFFGLMPFWVLQHERSASAYAPFINELDLGVTVSGTF